MTIEYDKLGSRPMRVVLPGDDWVLSQDDLVVLFVVLQRQLDDSNG